MSNTIDWIEIDSVKNALLWLEINSNKVKYPYVAKGVSPDIPFKDRNTSINTFVGKKYHNDNAGLGVIFKNIETYFEPDSSPFAWEYFIKYYTGKEFSQTKSVDLCKLYWGNSGSTTIYYQLHAVVLSDSKHKPRSGNKYNVLSNKPKASFRGDCDFNFDSATKTHIKKIRNNAEEYLLLTKCKEMHHSLLNFSLMLRTGGLNNIKNNKANDRLDKFLVFLKEYYDSGLEGRMEILRKAGLVKNDANLHELCAYLNSFTKFYDYCAKIYFLPTNGYFTDMMKELNADFTKSAWCTLLDNNQKLIDDLIEFGKETLDPPEHIIKYMLLAVRFWQAKETYFNLIDQVNIE